jgi:diguanylate cyclase (GGDEF)-like protein/PAS domain S-box-containing protein
VAARAATETSGALWRLLPHGGTLPEDAWRRRHHALLALLWVHVVGLTVFALARGYPVVHSLLEGSAVAAPAVLASVFHANRRAASAMVSIGLITSSAVLVHIWGGVIEAHFHFFVVIVLLTLYEDWLPFILAAGYVLLHHGVMGALDPSSVYNHPAAIAHPWRWAAIHAAFVAAAAAGAVIAWRLNEDLRAQTRVSEERFRGAFDDAPIGMALVSLEPDAFGRFIQVNRALCEILGKGEDELFGRSVTDVVEPDDTAAIQAVLRVEPAGEQVEGSWRRADGAVLVCVASFSVVHDKAGRAVHAIAQVQDVTESKRARELLEYQAHHDALTELPNRRRLMEDLERGLEDATPDDPVLLALFDLDGFKAYNDNFGHPAGDALLARLGRSLRDAVADRATAYRMGGDEFCVVGRLVLDAEPLAAVAAAALSATGDGFSISASYGAVELPVDGAEPAEALRKADQRLYASKGSGRASAGRQAADALLKALSERNPDLGIHLSGVTDLCEAVAERLELPPEQRTPLLQAAALHDVGKVGIPESVLNKPTALDGTEWEHIRTHTLIGERILSAAPALTHAAKIVRSTHERWDGKGYPDGLAGDEIPRASRVIAVCDAYDAMTSNRPYRPARSPEEALAELKAHAGSQFDPDVVVAFVQVLARRAGIETIA